MFYDIYRARGNDISELLQVARAHGYDNPGPITAFPPNRNLFPPDATPAALPSGAQVLVPWHPDVLRKLIATEEYLASEMANEARRLIEEQRESKESLEHFLVLVDSACMLANVGKGVGELVAHGAKGMTSAKLVSWFVTSRLEMLRDVAPMAVPAPSEPKRDFHFFVIHTLGPWTPSFWASVYAAIRSGDMNIYLYGSAAVEYQMKLKIKQQADAEINRLRTKIQEARQQLGMPFYQARI